MVFPTKSFSPTDKKTKRRKKKKRKEKKKKGRRNFVEQKFLSHIKKKKRWAPYKNSPFFLKKPKKLLKIFW